MKFSEFLCSVTILYTPSFGTFLLVRPHEKLWLGLLGLLGLGLGLGLALGLTGGLTGKNPSFLSVSKMEQKYHLFC